MPYPNRRGGGQPGADGKPVELQQGSGYVQWRYQGDAAWRNLMPLSMITGSNGDDGRTVDLQESEGWIQWRHQGDSQWQNIISMNEIRGADGRDGTDGADGSNGQPGASVDLRNSGGFVQWKRSDSSSWSNIISLSDLKGSDGANGSNGQNGSDGRAVQLQKSATHIQWRLAGDAGWQNLVALSDLTGSPGQNGTNGTNGANYTPQPMTPRAVNVATAYQHTDLTKPFKIIINARSTQTVTVAGTVNDKVELRVGPNAASVAPGGSGSFSVGAWESGIVGISLMIGAAVQDGGQLTADVPAGWYFQVNRLSGNSATIVSCFTQSMS